MLNLRNFVSLVNARYLKRVLYFFVSLIASTGQGVKGVNSRNYLQRVRRFKNKCFRLRGGFKRVTYTFVFFFILILYSGFQKLATASTAILKKLTDCEVKNDKRTQLSLGLTIPKWCLPSMLPFSFKKPLASKTPRQSYNWPKLYLPYAIPGANYLANNAPKSVRQRTDYDSQVLVQMAAGTAFTPVRLLKTKPLLKQLKINAKLDLYPDYRFVKSYIAETEKVTVDSREVFEKTTDLQASQLIDSSELSPFSAAAPTKQTGQKRIAKTLTKKIETSSKQAIRLKSSKSSKRHSCCGTACLA